MGSSRFLTELFDPGRWPVDFFSPASGKAGCWPFVGFTRFTSHPPCRLLWLLRINFLSKSWFKQCGGMDGVNSSSVIHSTYFIFQVPLTPIIGFTDTFPLHDKVQVFVQLLLFFIFTVFVRNSGQNCVVCLDIKVPDELMPFIFLERFWFVRITLVSMIKFIAQFPVDHLIPQSYLFLYSFCSSWLYSLFMW